MFIPMYVIFLNIINILIYICKAKTDRTLFLLGWFKQGWQVSAMHSLNCSLKFKLQFKLCMAETCQPCL